MLFAQCPRLSKLKFMKVYPRKSADAPNCHPLHLLCRSTKSLVWSRIPQEIWPVSFRSLREVVVGRFLVDRFPHEAFSATPQAIAPLFLLPNLDYLELALIIDHDNNDENSDNPKHVDIGSGSNDIGEDEFDPAGSNSLSRRTSSTDISAALSSSHRDDAYVFGCVYKGSSVKTLALNTCQIGTVPVRSFILACKGLREFRLCTNSQAEFEPGIFDSLIEHTATLKVLDLFSHSLGHFHTLDIRLSRFEKLTRLDVPVGHLVEYERGNGDMQAANGTRSGLSTASHEGKSRLHNMVWLGLRRYLLPSLEMLRVKGEWQRPPPEFATLDLLEALIVLITGGVDLERQHSKFKYICVATIPFFSPKSDSAATADKLERLCERQAVEMYGLQRPGDEKVF